MDNPTKSDTITSDTSVKEVKKIILQLEAIVEESHDAIIGKTLDGTIVTWNGGATRLFGYTREEMIGRSIADLFSPGNRDELPGLLEKIRKGETIASYDSIWVKKDGTSADVEFSLSPIHAKEGLVIGSSLVGRDITERKKMENRLNLSVSRLEDVQKIAKIGDWEANLISGELHWSELIFDIFGLDPKTFKPSVEAFYEAIHPDDKKRVAESEKLSEQTGVHDVVHRIIRPNSEVRFVHEIAKRYKDNDGKLVMLRGIVQDITESKLEAERLEKSKKVVEGMNKFMVDRELRMIELKGEIKLYKEEIEKLKKLRE